MPSIRHFTWPLSIWKRHLIVYPDVLSGGLFTSQALMSGWRSSYRACMKMPEAKCMLVTTWVMSSVWKWVFIKVPAWAPYCSSWFWKPSPRSFVQDVPGKTCMQMTWSSSLKLLEELQEKLIPEDQRGTKGTSGQHWRNRCPDIWAGARCASEVWQIPLWRVSQGHLHKFHFLWWLFQLDPQEMQWHPWPFEVWCQLQV